VRVEAVDDIGAAAVVIAVESDGAATHRAVLDGLIAYNRVFMAPPDSAPLILAARRGDGTLVGGVVGETLWGSTGDGWFQLALLWVVESARRQGVGRQLLHAAEREAARRGCRHVALDTFDFQARPFYERAGYSVFGTQEHYPPGHRRYFLRKTLVAGADAP
jgi:GNAT superfamily N-acetyltransferase